MKVVSFETTPKEVVISDSRLRFGIWEFRFSKKTEEYYANSISRTGFNNLLFHAGFRKLPDAPEIIVQVNRSVIEEKSISEIKDFIHFYLEKIPDAGINLKTVQGAASKEELTELYLRQYNSVINQRYLEHLQPLEKPILSDTKEQCHLPFKDKIVKISKAGVELADYSETNEFYVWNTQIIQRPFNRHSGIERSHFQGFIENICNSDSERISACRSAIGYLVHNYSSPVQGQAIILYDEVISDIFSPQGGTGKGLFANSIGQIRCISKIDGKQMDPTARFAFQQVNPSTQVIWIDDASKNFDFSALFSHLTDGVTVEKKNQPSFLIPVERTPKFLICSNSIFDSNGSSHKRRQFTLEFSDYYAKKIKNGTEQPIIEEHGCVFFDQEEWDKKEWELFDNYMVECVLSYLKKGLISYSAINLGQNRLIQSTGEDFFNWVLEKNYIPDTRYETKLAFEDFKQKFYGVDDRLSQRGFTQKLKTFAKINNWKHQAISSGGKQYFMFIVV